MNFDLIKSELENGISYESGNILKNNIEWSDCNRFDLVLVKLIHPNEPVNEMCEIYTPNDIISQFNQKYLQEKRPSVLIMYDLMIDYLTRFGTLKIKHRCVISLSNPEILRLDIPNTPPVSTVMKMHMTCPWLCGYFFEELFDIAVNNEYPNLILKYNHTSIIPELNIANIKPILSELCNCPVDYYLPISRISCKNDIYYILIKIFIKQIDFAKNYFEFYYQFLSISRFVQSNLYEIQEYAQTLKSCQFIGNMQLSIISSGNKLAHSVKVINDNIIGEIDFLSNDSIIDIKCCIKDNLDKYRYQLMYYYKTLPTEIAKNIKKLIIINLMKNQIYVYNINTEIE